ncbi:MAG TPA: DUF6489 family protein [Allosphingosinicella sp.]
MKVSVDIDCTPEEARRFLGLPDLSPVHEAYVEQMKKAVAEAGSAEQFGEAMKSWSSMGEGGLALWRQMLEQMSKP